MGYVESNLGKDEKILARITHSKAALISAIVAVGICLAVGLGLWYGVGAILARIEENDKAAEETIDLLVQIFGVLQIVFLIIPLLVGVALFLHSTIAITCNQLVVTNKRLVGRKGLISKDLIDILLLKLDNVRVKNNMFGALFHYGTLEVVSAGSQQIVNGRTANLEFPYVKNTEEFRKAVLAAVDKAKEEDREAQAKAQAAALKRAQEDLSS